MPLKYKITKESRFEAAHHLEGVGAGHKCSRNHGHSYRVLIDLESLALDERGFVIDYDLLHAVVVERYDHQDLNRIMKENPTAENIAKEIFEVLSQMLFRIGYASDVKIIRVVVEEGAGGGVAEVSVCA